MKKALGLAACGLFFTACAAEPENNNTSEEEGSPENAEEQEMVGGEEYLQFGIASDPVSLDPHGANENVSNSINSTIYDRLVYFNEDLEIEQGLAEDLEQIEDDVWEVTVREGVTFHDGEELTPEVIQRNFERILDPDMGSPVAFIFDMIEDITVVDDSTLHITTEYPFAPLPSHLAHPGGSIVSPAIIDASYENLENGEDPFEAAQDGPAGTGYFQYEEYEPGNYVRLAKNEEYWDEEQAKVEGISFRVIPEGLTRIGELETGSLDIAYPINPSDMDRLEEADGVGVQQSESARMAYLGFNTEASPFDDADVRRAVHMAVNKEDIIEGVLAGTGREADYPIAPEVFGYSEDAATVEQDLEEAEQLLSEAGYEDGFETTLLTNDDRENEDAAQLIQAQLSQIGIEVSIESYEQGTYLEMAGEGNSEMFLGSWGTVTLDADYGLYPVFHSNNKGAAGNRSFLDNEEIDALLTEARQESDEEERLQLYEEAQNLLVEESPYAYLYYPDLVAGVSEDVEGFWQVPSSFHFLRDTEINR
ncbi:glutathione ABC transporter substrate-binding protein [Alkalicoccus halolimnae]|uniref:Glutathione ABC transporter substrate-binding protein n=1 Tax=Alkalicoccus halolimnae TaxID=1667239 RepID=A0AAJ8LRW5_9BACI|nr:glutathione ABC transporter substrate-binding protein [Alkalicoccus halolimnae]